MDQMQALVADVMREAIKYGYSLEKTARVLADAFEGADPGFDRNQFENDVDTGSDEDDPDDVMEANIGNVEGR